MGIILLVLQSCKSLDPTILHNATQHYTTLHHTADTLIIHDSIFIREVIKGDTIYLSRTEYCDRWRTRLVHDTIYNTQYVEKIIEKPPERYVPRFYKLSTAILYILIALAIVSIVVKLKVKTIF